MDTNKILNNIYKKTLELGKTEGLINNKPSVFLVRDCNDSSTNMVDYKTIISNSPFNQGDIIDIDGKKYLIVDKDEEFNKTYSKGTFRKAQDVTIGDIVTTSLTNTFNTLAIVDVNKDVVVSTDMISLISDEMKFILPYSSLISINKGILYKNNIFKITHIDNSKDNILTVIAKFNTKAVNYSIALSDSVITQDINTTYKITPICKADSQVVSDAVVNYSSNNDSIATVDTNGLVNLIGVGSCAITCEWNGVSCVLNVTVKEVADVTYTITGEDTIKLRTPQIYTVTPEVGTIEFELDEYTIEGNIAEIIATDSYSCTVKALISNELGTIQAIINNKVVATLDFMTTKY